MPAPVSAAATVRAPDQGVVGQGALFTVAGALFWSLSGVLVRLVEAAGSWQIVLYRSLAMTATLLLILGLRYGGRGLGAFRPAGGGGGLGGGGGGAAGRPPLPGAGGRGGPGAGRCWRGWR